MAGAQTSVSAPLNGPPNSTLDFLDSTLSAHGRRTSVSAPLRIHPKTPAPMGREPTRTGQPPDQFVSQAVRRASTTSLREMS